MVKNKLGRKKEKNFKSKLLNQRFQWETLFLEYFLFMDRTRSEHPQW
jgi:hypothetical protein